MLSGSHYIKRQSVASVLAAVLEPNLELGFFKWAVK